MDLKYALTMLLKILISTPTTLFFVDQFSETNGAALLGDPFINKNNSTLPGKEEEAYYDYDLTENQDLENSQVFYDTFNKLCVL